MKARAFLKDYIKKSQPYLNSFFKTQEKQAARISPIAVEMMRVYRHFMGGKNIRGSLTKLGYECFGGKDERAILKASLMVEVTHAFALMHDDIMDNDILRRGRPTIHVQYKNLHQKRYKKGEADHYGLCLALDMGDAGFVLAHLILAESGFPSEIKNKVLRRFNQVLLDTVFGQAVDVSYEHLDRVSEKDVLRVHHYKTANYTITGPLQYGALFAGASDNQVKKIEKYGLPVGIAFQLRDDELGLFADEKTLGKPVGSDVKENKNTLLHLKALELAKGEDKKFVKSIYGKKNITKKELDRVRRITQETGSLAYSQKMAKRLVEQGKKFIPLVSKNSGQAETLANMADFMIERGS